MNQWFAKIASTAFGKLRNRFSHAEPARHRLRKDSGLRYGAFEQRRLLAGIQFDADIGQIFIGGTNSNDTVRVTQVGDMVSVTYESRMTFIRESVVVVDVDSDRQTFHADDVDSIFFVGLRGDDYFENRTGIDSFAYGQVGNDTLIGGSGSDRLVGNGNDDSIFGNGGDDVLIAGLGNDDLDAGAGNDRVLGVGGTNRLEGGAGNDTIYGGQHSDNITDLAGDNLLVGSNGNDRIIGSRGIDRIFGGGGDDFIRGGSGNDLIFAQGGNDTIFGGAGDDTLGGNDGNDVLHGELGSDRMIGGAGNDQINFAGNIVSYEARRSGPNTRINELGGTATAPSDLVIGAEEFVFADIVRTRNDLLNPPQINETITVQPIITANDNGSNKAEFFGNAQQQLDIEKRIDTIFAQAGIDVEFLPARTFNNTFFNVGNGGTRPGSDLNRIVTGGDAADVNVGSSDRNIVDMYFVEAVPSFGDVGENIANGLAFIGVSGVTVHVGDNLVNSAEGRAIIARVTAHEMAHNLGLRHVSGADNLLAENGTSIALTETQINAVIASTISRRI